MTMPTVALDLHAIGAGLVVFFVAVLMVSAFVAFSVLFQRVQRISSKRKRAIKLWALVGGTAAVTLVAWVEIGQGSASFLSAYMVLHAAGIFAYHLRRRPKPGRFEQTSPTMATPWERTSTPYRAGAVVLIALSLSAGTGLLALAITSR